MDLQQQIKELAATYFDEIVKIRRHFHQNPELAYEEYKTSTYIQRQLTKIGITFKKGYVKTGIVGKIKGRNPGKYTVALRSDMDALPVVEKNEIPFQSKSIGKMHACGHDFHMASLLGSARILYKLKNHFEGTVLLVFQPAEEKLPGGAKLMMEEGAFKDQEPDLIIGQHVMPGLKAGQVGFRAGVYMASSDEIYITVTGKGGHAAMPHQLVDTVLIASHIVVSLQQIVSRNANVSTPSVLSFGKIDAPGATNIIPGEVKLEGTFRTMDESWRMEAHSKITSLAKAIAEGMGGKCEVKIVPGYPVLINNEEITRNAIAYSKEFLGERNVVDLDVRMTSEDFAYYTQHYPSVFYRFGITDPQGKYTSPLHSSTFMADEKALITGMANLAWLAVSFLNK